MANHLAHFEKFNDLPIADGVILKTKSGMKLKVINITNDEVRFTVQTQLGWSDKPSLISRANFQRNIDDMGGALLFI